ncbi:glycine betaine/L-proline ABC transporter ATP-binding protein [Massilibacteroides sp.]|uniref:quaternary amine ABC transporter ATP-binding protein n=1 Tax=Massilibacteroides sp. TaxID=2034766 RepID=UPI00261C1346|nr:glycine betaine/L-proline ABC transporter ATP-binding protein [Massilibacteroides sp.]MDD4514500.1 glycine betaine/L-proline ABC transporter ATP-binding protein [Massilibacteroides sp.]
MGNKIEVKNLHLIFGSSKKQAIKMLKSGATKEQIHNKTKCTVAVNNANLTINEGEIFVIMGLSGSGKSSLLRCFNMLNIPTRGSIEIDGKDITQMNKKELLEFRRKKVGMVFQHFGLLPHRTIVENVAFGLEIQETTTEDRLRKAREVIDLVGLKGYEDSYPHQLSGGMQQRVGIARAIATDSDILLMDEAFSALDPLIRVQMQDDLIELQQSLKKTIIFITHDLDEAVKLGSRIAIMNDGVIVQQGEPEEILLHPANDYVREFVGNVDMSKVVTASSIMRVFREKLVLGKDGPAYAARKMSQNNFRFMATVNNSGVFQGYIVERDVRRLLEKNEKDLSKIVMDIPQVNSGTPLSDLLPLYIQQKYPLVVVNEKGIPLGYVDHTDVVSLVTGYNNGEVKEIIENASN